MSQIKVPQYFSKRFSFSEGASEELKQKCIAEEYAKEYARLTRPIQCECGSVTKKWNKYKHERSKKHLAWVAQNDQE